MAELTNKSAPLEDIMLAMDVVDTLRHRQGLIDKELDADKRRAKLIAKLKDIYAAQGMEVTDAMLEEGVDALEQDRFRYDPPQLTLQHRLALLYVYRHHWLKPLLITLGLVFILWFAWFQIVAKPRAQSRAELPQALESSAQFVKSIAATDKPIQLSQHYLDIAKTAIANGDYQLAAQQRDQINSLIESLNSYYKIRIVSAPDKRSGVWRVPDINTNARNYYLIVEAVDPSGKILNLDITDEENGVTLNVSSWGVRVDEAIFNRVKSDVLDDGIIQRRDIGQKHQGYLTPEYSIDTSGATINRW